MFLFISILVMWLMIFGVSFFYVGSLNEKLESTIIYQFVIAVLITSLVWLFGGYSFSFQSQYSTIFSLDNWSIDELLNMLFQLCFCLYAVVMLIGSFIDRVKTKALLGIVIIWVLTVYCPLAYLIWNEHGFLSQLGVLDFSGGLVVHLSAGVSTYVLAYIIGKTPHKHEQTQNKSLFLGMLFVTLGWFGFNAGPVGELNQSAGVVLVNTLLAILFGGLVWSGASCLTTKKEDVAILLNGMIVGLVTSTAGVGYLHPFQLILVVSFASLFTYYLTNWLGEKIQIDDVVDSFGMNGLGGLFGSLGLILFRPQIIGAELLAIGVTLTLSVTVSIILGKIFLKKKHDS
ncbi:MAG: ammonium transporter [Streptococcus sp.]|nr:ammonium transporter [Streptococcus sp.]